MKSKYVLSLYILEKAICFAASYESLFSGLSTHPKYFLPMRLGRLLLAINPRIENYVLLLIALFLQMNYLDYFSSCTSMKLAATWFDNIHNTIL